jgi:MprA protease rhombosortase-interaction domain-containing protein
MRIRVCALAVGAVLFCLGPAASAVTIDWVPIGNPANLPDNTGLGSVASAYNIDKYEVTNAQYAGFLNAKAASDPLGLYDTLMSASVYGGITRSGLSGSYTYSAIAGRADMPVNFVSFYDAARFANWLNNGQGIGDTETGAYTLLGGTAIPSNGTIVTRNAGATIFLPSENEWYKAAYYNAITTSYFDYTAGSDSPTTCGAPTAAANQANCESWAGVGSNVTIKGSYTGSSSPYGTFDQGGNVDEWNDSILFPGEHGLRGGGFLNTHLYLSSASSHRSSSSTEYSAIGFRVAAIASVPEPSTGLLLMVGLLGFARRRRVA